MVTTTAGDELLPLNYFFAYETDETGTVLDPEPMPGIADATEMPDGLILTRTHYGLRFTTPEDDPVEDTGGPIEDDVD